MAFNNNFNDSLDFEYIPFLGPNHPHNVNVRANHTHENHVPQYPGLISFLTDAGFEGSGGGVVPGVSTSVSALGWNAGTKTLTFADNTGATTTLDLSGAGSDVTVTDNGNGSYDIDIDGAVTTIAAQDALQTISAISGDPIIADNSDVQSALLALSAAVAGVPVTAITDNGDGTYGIDVDGTVTTIRLQTALETATAIAGDPVIPDDADVQSALLALSAAVAGVPVTAVTDNADGTYAIDVDGTVTNIRLQSALETATTLSGDPIIADNSNVQAALLALSTAVAGAQVVAITDNADGTYAIDVDGTVTNIRLQSALETATTITGDPIISDNASVQAALVEITGAISTMGHTTVDTLDFKPTANPNEYTVELTGTDADGNTFTIVDSTPVVILPQTATLQVSGAVNAVGADHSNWDVHLQAGADLTIDGADWEDGQWFTLSNTTNADIDINLPGFFVRFIRDGEFELEQATLTIPADSSFMVRVTVSGILKMLNFYPFHQQGPKGWTRQQFASGDTFDIDTLVPLSGSERGYIAPGVTLANKPDTLVWGLSSRGSYVYIGEDADNGVLTFWGKDDASGKFEVFTATRTGGVWTFWEELPTPWNHLTVELISDDYDIDTVYNRAKLLLNPGSGATELRMDLATYPGHSGNHVVGLGETTIKPTGFGGVRLVKDGVHTVEAGDVVLAANTIFQTGVTQNNDLTIEVLAGPTPVTEFLQLRMSGPQTGSIGGTEFTDFNTVTEGNMAVSPTGVISLKAGKTYLINAALQITNMVATQDDRVFRMGWKIVGSANGISIPDGEHTGNFGGHGNRHRVSYSTIYTPAVDEDMIFVLHDSGTNITSMKLTGRSRASIIEIR